MTAAPSITFVTCVESGPLESMALRLFESMRRFGGRFADCPQVAVKPRFGPPLARNTLAQLDTMGVELLDIPAHDGASWAAFANKTRSIAAVEQTAATDTIAFLDGDILVTGEPDGLDLGNDLDFAACAIHEKGVASAGPNDPGEPFWTAIYNALNLDLAQVPFLETTTTRQRVRMHFNGGVFAYRRATQLGTHAHQAFLSLLEAKVAHVNLGIHMFDEVAIAAMVSKHGLRWRALPNDHNCSIPSWSSGGYQPALYRGAKLLHYHNAMAPENWPRFLDCLRAEHPSVAQWLFHMTPISPPKKGLNPAFFLNTYRAMVRKRHLRGCRRLGI